MLVVVLNDWVTETKDAFLAPRSYAMARADG